MQKRGHEIKGPVAVVAQLHRHQAHAPCGRPAGQRRHAVGKTHHQRQKGEKEQPGKGGEGQDQQAKDDDKRHIDDPSQQPLASDAVIELRV